jgi:amphi-Trp domain-containing protein
MADVEIKRTTKLTRKEAGERLIVLGNALAGDSSAEVEYDGSAVKLAVPGDLSWEFELEVEGDEVELEIELKWTMASTHEASARKASARDVSASEASAPAAERPARARKSAKSTRSAKSVTGTRRGGGRRTASSSAGRS